jgi:hypothetical protein
MAKKKLSEFEQVTHIHDTDTIPLVQTGLQNELKLVTPALLAAYMVGKSITTTSEFLVVQAAVLEEINANYSQYTDMVNTQLAEVEYNA